MDFICLDVHRHVRINSFNKDHIEIKTQQKECTIAHTFEIHDNALIKFLFQ